VQAKQFIALGQREEARKILLPLVKRDKRNEQAWLLVSEAVEDEGKQIAALTNALRVNPANEDAQLRLKNLKHFRDNPLDLASLYEEEGKFDEAIAALHRAALTFNYGPEFDRIYANIERLERRKTSGVVHIRPTHSIARLTFGPPVLFFLLMLVHNQMNPFAFTPLLWLGVLMTLGGGFLLALANVRSRHPLWVKLFDDPSASSSPLARLTVSLAGWLLLFIAFAYLLQSSFNRLPLLTTNTFLHP
jgi:tetratricopeptide (TPR) repeat protein